MTGLKFNVAQLLREPIGSRREYDFREGALPLDDTLVLRDIAGRMRVTRTASGVFLHILVQGVVRLTCVRSLEEFEYLVTLDEQDEFHSIIDVVTGTSLQRPTEEDPFYLDELHMADVGEMIREYTLLALPLNPVCEAYRDQPVQYSVQSDGIAPEDEDEPVDERLQILKQWANRQDNSTN